MTANTHYRRRGREGRQRRRRKPRLRGYGGRVRRAGGRLDRGERRRARGSRHGAARAGDDGRRGSTPSFSPAAPLSGSMRPAARWRIWPRQGRGFPARGTRVPIVPGASLFDLVNGGDKAWGRPPPYWEMGYSAAQAAGPLFALGTAGAGFGADAFGLKGGLGSASALTARGFRVGALAAATRAGASPAARSAHFRAAPLRARRRIRRPRPTGPPVLGPSDAGLRGEGNGNTILVVVATDAALDQGPGQAPRDHGRAGFALALPAGALAGRRRRRLRRRDGARGPRRRPPRPDRDRHARRRMRRPFDRPRRLRGDAAAVPGALPSWKQRFGA